MEFKNGFYIADDDYVPDPDFSPIPLDQSSGLLDSQESFKTDSFDYISEPLEYVTDDSSIATDIKRVGLAALEGPFELASDVFVRPFVDDKEQYDIETAKKFRSAKETLLNIIGDDTPEEISKVLDTETGETRTPDTFTGKVFDIGTYLVGGGFIYKTLGKLTKLGKASRGVIAEQATEQLLTSPDYNMANLVQDLKKEPNAVVDYLAADKNEDALLNRAKLVLTSGLFAGSLAGIYKLGFSAVNVEKASQKILGKSAKDATEEELPEVMGELLKQAKGGTKSKVVKEVKKAAEDDEKGVAQIVNQSTKSLSGKFKWFNQRWLKARGFFSEKAFAAQEEAVSSQMQKISKATHIAQRLQKLIDDRIQVKGNKNLINKITEALESGNTKGLPKDMASEITSARKLIDELSTTMLDNNIGGEVLRRSIEKNMGQYIRKSYRLFEDKNFVPDSALYEEAVETLIEAQGKARKLKTISVQARKKFDAKARAQLDNLLDRSELNTFNDYVSKVGRINKQFFKGRKDIDPTIRKLMGEVESPTENIILTVQKLSSITENHKFYNTLETLGGSVAASPSLYNRAIKAAREESKNVDIEDIQKTFKEGTFVTDIASDSTGKILKVNKGGSFRVEFKDSITGKKTQRTVKDADDLELISPDNRITTRAKEIYEEGGGSYTDEKYIFENKKGIFNTKIEGTGSALDGKYTTQEMARAVNNLEDTHLLWGAFSKGLKNNEVIRYYSAAKGTNQMMRTIYDHTTHLRNALGGFQFGLANGLNPVSRGKTNFNVLHNEISQGGNKVFDDFYEKLQGLGIINTSVRAGEARALINIAAESNPARFASKLTKHSKVYSKVDNVNKYFVKRPEDVYMATDDYFKMNAFVNELDTLKKARPNAPLEVLEKEAAEIIKQTFPNYNRVFKGAKALRELPVGNFVSFPAEILRTSFNIGLQGIKELSSGNKALMARGAKRLTGFTTVNLGYYVAGSAGWSTLGFNKQEVEALNTLNEGYSDTPKTYTSIGESLYVQDTQQVAAYASIAEPILEALQKFNKGIELGETEYDAMTDGLFSGFKKLADPFSDEAMFTEAMGDIYTAIKSGDNRAGDGTQLWTDSSNMVEGMFTHLFNSFAPGIFLDVKKLREAVNEVPNPKTGLTRSVEARLLEFGTGVNFRKFTPETQFRTKVIEYYSTSQYDTARAKAKYGQKQSDFFKEYTVEQGRKFEASQELYRHIRAMQTLGISNNTISNILKQNGVKSSQERFALLNGKFLPRKLSASDIFDFQTKVGDDFKTLEQLRLYTNYISNTSLAPTDELELRRSRAAKSKLSFEDFEKRKFSTGGEVEVPNAPTEPDERIDKNTGLPYNMQAGSAYMDDDDPLRRLGFMGGGEVDPLVRLGLFTGGVIVDDSNITGFENPEIQDAASNQDATSDLHSGALYKAVTSDRDLETEIKETDKGSFFGGSRAYDMAVEKIKQDKAAGKITDFEEKLRLFGAGADLVFSPIGDLLSVPLGLAGKGIKAITPDSIEESVAETTQETVQKVSKWLDENPQFKRHAKNVNALVSIAGFVPATRILKTGFNNVASNTDLILPNFYKKGVKKVEQYGIAGTHYTMAAPKAFVEALLPAGIARRNRTIGIRKREEIEKMSEQSAADMVAGVIQGKNIIEQSPKGKVDDLISDGAINKSYGYEQLSMANKADVKNAMFNKYVDFDIPEHIQDRMMNHMYFGPYKTGKGVVGTNVTGFVGEQFKVPVLLKPIDPAKTTIDIKNPKGIQNQAYEAHGGHSRGPAKLNRLFNVNGRAKLAVVISKLDKNGNDKFAGKKNSIDNKTNIKKEAKNIKNVDNIIANATPEQMKKALATSWGTKEGSDIGIVFKVDEKNPNTIYFQDVYKSGSKESGGVNAMIAVDLDSKKVYNMVTDKHDMLANFKPFGVGSTDRITGTVPTMRSFANIKEKGNHVGRDFKEEARLSLKQLDEYQLDIPESGILSVPTYDAVTGLIPTGRKQREIVGSKKINRNTLEKIANAKNIEEILNKNGDLAGYKVDGKKMSKAELDSGVNVNASIIQHYAGKATAKDYGDFARRIGQLYLVSGESATVEEARQGRVLNALRKGAI